MLRKFYILFIICFEVIFCHLTNIDQDDPVDSKYWPQSEVNSLGKGPGLSNNECVKRIYRDCNHPTHFTDKELENVRQFFNYSFTVLADVKPDKPLCPKLHVRHDWKCLPQQQKTRIINVWKKMYKRGDIQRLADLHVRYWPPWHKISEFVANHRWLCNQFEKSMQSFDKELTLPYWYESLYGCQPERSSVWDVLGHSGNYSGGYCVQDGIYKNSPLIPCVKRHWSPRGTIYPWVTPEVRTSDFQSNDFGEFVRKMDGKHFHAHLNIGGYEGQFAITDAAYDLIFFMYHNSQLNNLLLRFQLRRPEFLTPLSYNDGIKYNPKTGVIERADIRTDRVTGIPSVTVREMYWLGFGDLCYVPDNLVRPINRVWKGMPNGNSNGYPIPAAIKRLRALPKWILVKYFPYFLSDNYSEFDHFLEEVGECNTRCLPLPKLVLYNETEIGRRQLESYAYDNGHYLKDQLLQGENTGYQLWRDLTSVGYCSPYVTTY